MQGEREGGREEGQRTEERCRTGDGSPGKVDLAQLEAAPGRGNDGGKEGAEDVVIDPLALAQAQRLQLPQRARAAKCPHQHHLLSSPRANVGLLKRPRGRGLLRTGAAHALPALPVCTPGSNSGRQSK